MPYNLSLIMTGELLNIRIDFQAPATSSQVVALVELHDSEIASPTAPEVVVEETVVEQPAPKIEPAPKIGKLSSLRNASPPRSRQRTSAGAPKLSMGKT